MAEGPELLFFDTFSHETSEELNLDLVQFTKTVCVTEIRIIPLGARVQADFPGGVRLGATNPSQFKIEFFVNDLSKPGASTFESLGGVEYNQNGNIHLECEHRIPTDGLVLRGWYTTITLAVYGHLTKAIIQEVPPPGPVQPLPDPRAPPDSIGPGSTAATAEWVQQHAQVGEMATPVEHSYMVEPPRDPYNTTYSEESYPPPQDYPSHHYQEEWQQSGHTEGYTAPKEEYEGSVMQWEQRTSEDKMHWERGKDRERDMRHRSEREYREHSRDCSPDYERPRGPRGDYHFPPRGPPPPHHRAAAPWPGRPRTPPAAPPVHRPGARTPPQPPAQESEVRASLSPQLRSDQGSLKRGETASPAPFESLSPGDVESISEGEIPEAEGEGEGEIEGTETGQAQGTPLPTSPTQHEDHSLDVEQFEPILSDEEIADDSDPQFQDMDYDFSDYPEDPIKTFNPYSCELMPMVYLGDPAVSSVDWETKKLEKTGEKNSRLEDLLDNVSLDLSTGSAKEEWVHNVEQAFTIVNKHLPCAKNKEACINKLIKWVEIGLNFEEALSQPQPGYKLRHIKAGIRLVETMCQCGEDVTSKLMNAVNIQQKLIDLYHKDYMALSIKLMILRSLDASLRYNFAVEKFLHDDSWNGYRKLLEMVQGNQLARVKFAITSLLQKLHIYEVLDKLNKTVSELVDDGKEREDQDVCETEVDIESISIYLEEIVKVYNEAPTLISHPKRFLPVSAQFEIGPSSSYPDPYPALYTFYRYHKLIESFLILLTHPGTSCYSSIVVPVYEMIGALLDSQDGLRFLASTPNVTNQLHRILVGNSSNTEEADESSQGSLPQLGLHLIYRLQALSHIDTLLNYFNDGKTDPDNAEVFEHLQHLYCLTFTAIGKISVTHVLSCGDHISVLLKLFKCKQVDKDIKVKKAPGRGYIADLIITTVKYSDHVPFLQKYAREILDLIAKDNSHELNEVLPWLKPVENQSAFAYDDVRNLCEIIKKNVDNATSLPGELITAVRVLKYLGIPPKDKDVSPSSPESLEYCELKYKCVIIQLFSLEGVNNLISVLQKLCEHYEQPSLHAARLVGRQGLSLTSFILPAVQLIRRILTNVIKCRNTEFKDLTAIPVLLQTYTLMQAIPVNAHAHIDAQRICREIIETLLAYTQPVSSETTSETEALNKSLWTLMMSEVLKYIIVSPHTFLPGLSILSELLPLPLQVQTRTPLPEEEITRVVNSRKLWSAHLHPLNGLLHDFISTMSGSSYQPLLQVLRSVCVQLADLAAPTALTVTRAVLDSIANSVTPVDHPVSGYMMRLLNFLACLVTHASIKAAVIHLTVRNQAVKDERYPNLIVSLCHILRATFDSQIHIQAQECIISIVQSLCHTELTLLPPPGMLLVGGTASTPPEIYFANTLPPRDLLGTLILVMLEHVSNMQHSLTTLQPTIRTFLMLTEHDYGFFHLRNCLEKKTDTLWNLLAKLCSVWSKERSECLSVLSATLELIRACMQPEEADESLGLPARSLVITPQELALILGWDKSSEEDKHPLYCIDTLLQESRAEDDSLETLCENVTELIKLLEEEGSKPIEAKEINEPLLPAPESLIAQFAARPVFIVGDVDDDRLSAAYWLATPPLDDQDTEMEQVQCDLLELAHSNLPELVLAEKVAQLCRHKMTPGDLEHAAPSGKKRTTNMTSEQNNRRPFVAPMRGRGFRGAVQRGDMFRSRPPNTSRPPSLHVDDFVALETCGQQPTGPTGYNKISMRVAQDMMATRARGRGRAFGLDRGVRFFASASPYPQRRENGAGRGGLSPIWHAEGPTSAVPGVTGVPSTAHSFRPPPPDMRGIRPPDPSHFTARPLRAPPPIPAWAVKDNRERFQTPPMRGGPPHRDPTRHMRFFAR